MSRFTLLLWKNYRLRRYRWFLTLVEIYLPILLIYLAIIYGNSTQTLYSVTKTEIIADVDTEKSLVSPGSYDFSDFRTVYYAPSNDFTDYLVKSLRKKFNFLSTKGLRDEYEFRNYPSKYDSIGLLFFNIYQLDSSEKLSYEIVIGDTIEYMNNVFYWFKNAEGSRKLYIKRLKFQAAIQLAINKAYISLQTESPVTEETLVQEFPRLEDEHGAFYLPRIEFSEYAVYVILIVCLISSARLIYSMILEKSIGSKELMKAAGAKEWTIWCSWFADSFLIMFIVFALITVSFKFAFKYQELAIFPYANGYLLGAFIILYGTANIAYSLFITALCNRVFTAACLFTLSAIVPLFSTIREAIMGYSILVYLNCMLPVGALIQGFQRIQFFETHGGMNSWKAFYSNENDEGIISVSLAYTMLMLILQIIFCLSFTIYYNSVKTNGKSQSKRSWFIFECCSKSNRDGAKSLKILEDAFSSSVIEDMPDDREICIEVRDLFVSDGVNFPLKGISMDIYKGEINVLVGETESGTTALTSVLTGSTRSTSGSIYCNGEDIVKNSATFKRNIGLCSKESSLFPYLSVSDHLSFYAKLKKSRVPNEINLLLKLGELEDSKDLLAEELDNFTKRKLCLAIALVGNPEILIINELCAEVSSEYKQSLRNLLMDFRENRTIILTTNDVEEADAMSDHVTVFNTGSIVANGTMCFIRNALDVGYQLKLTKVHSTTDSSQVNALFNSTAVEAVLKEETETELIYLLPGMDTNKYCKFFQNLEKESFSLGLNSWKLSHVALLDILKSSVNQNPDAATLSLSDAEIPYQKETGLKLRLQQIFSLLKKKSLYAIRNRFSMFVQVILFTLIALFLLRMTDKQSKVVNDTINYSLETYYTPKVLLQYPEDTKQRSFFTANVEYLLSRGVELDFSFESSLIEDLISSDMKRSEAYKNGILFACGFNATKHVLLFNPFRLDSLPKAVTAYSNVLLQYLTRNVDNKIVTIFREAPDGYPRCPLYKFSLQIYVYWYIALAFCTVDLLWYFYKFTNTERCVANTNIISHVPKKLYWMVNFGFDAVFLFSVLLARVLIFRAFGDSLMFLTLGSYLYIFVCSLVLFGLGGLLFVYVIGYVVRFKKPRYKWFLVLNVLATIAALYISSAQLDYYRFGYKFSSSRLSMSYFFVKSILSLIPSVNFLSIFTILEYSWIEDACSTSTKSYDMPKVRNTVLSFASPGTPYGSFMGIAFQCFSILLFFGVLIAIEGGSFKRCFRRIVTAVGSYRLVRNEDLENETYRSNDKSDQKLINEDEKEKNASLSSSDLKEMCRTMCRYVGLRVRSYVRRKTNPWSSFMKDGNLYVTIDDTKHTVKSGECFGVVGRRRAGKSSLLESLSLLEKGVKRDVSEIAYGPQEDGLLGELTGREMLNFAVSVSGIRNKDIDEIVSKWIGNLGLEEQQNRRCDTYDRTDKRRLCVAMALVNEARVIFLDEPFKDLDLESKQILRKELENCKRRGQIVILSSESLKEVENLCESVVFLKSGKLHCIGTISQLRELYEQGFTIAVKTMNVIPNGENLVNRLRESMKNLVYPISCVYKGENKGTFWYYVDDSGLPCSVLFDRLEEVKSSHIIVSDYVVTNTTLSEALDSF